MVVAWRGATAAGCCAVFDRGGGTSELKRMIVNETARSQGAGAALLAGAEEAGRRVGSRTLVLEVRAKVRHGMTLR